MQFFLFFVMENCPTSNCGDCAHNCLDSVMRFVVKQIPPGLTQTEAAIMVVHQWALRDPAGAASWVESFPEGPIRDRAVNELKGLARLQARK